MDKQIKGRIGENLAIKYLINNGYIILERNKVIYRSNKKWLEIDILASKKGINYLIEVKYRTSNKFGTVYETINSKKILKLTQYIESQKTCFIPLLITIQRVQEKNVINEVLITN